MLSREPGIREIQQKAIRYAEVYPEKISNWRKQARLKAFMPELDLSYDKTVFTSTSFPQGRGFVGPLDWGVSLSWDLGDLVFSSEQTSIDVRSRLMVQLRDDILDEVTRLYFERRRLQLELASQDSLSPKARSEKELRLEELAASIDGLTGGYLSERLEDKNKMLKIRRYFVTGLLLVLPIFISFYVLFVVFRFVDGIFGGLINNYLKANFGFFIPGVGFILGER